MQDTLAKLSQALDTCKGLLLTRKHTTPLLLLLLQQQPQVHLSHAALAASGKEMLRSVTRSGSEYTAASEPDQEMHTHTSSAVMCLNSNTRAHCGNK